jgi:hypothetical protein
VIPFAPYEAIGSPQALNIRNGRLLLSSRPNMENGTTTQGEGRDPSGFLSEIIGSQVTVKLNSGVVYKGMVSFTNTGILLIECL